MPAPTVSAAITKTGSTLTLTLTHSTLAETLAVAGVVTNGSGAEAPFSTSATFPGGYRIDQAGGKTWTLQSQTATQTVLTATV